MIKQAIFSVQNLQNNTMHTLLLLRHAQAVLTDLSGKDFDRALSKTGRSDAALQVQRLLQTGIIPDVILHSPALRTMQTAQIFQSAINNAYPHILPALHSIASLYRADASGYIREIRAHTPQEARCVLIAGHNPSIEDCALMFTPADSPAMQRISYGFPTAGIAMIETEAGFADLSIENAQLTRLFLPHES